MAKILIIEDDPRLENTYDTVFSKHGHDVIRAHDGEEGLKLAESEDPDIILLDILMPRMHGIDFLKHYDAPHKHPNVRIIVFSNMESDDLLEQAMSLGANSYEVKSRFSPNELAKLVNDTLRDRAS